MFAIWRQFWSRRRPNSSTRKAGKFVRRRPQIEQLESRWTPSFTLTGTSGDDVFSFAADASGYTVTLNGSPQFFTPVQESNFQLVGNGGNDTVTIQGSVATGPQTAHLAPQSGQWTGPSYSVDVSDIDTILALGSPGDSAFLDDSSGDDLFTAAAPGRASCWNCSGTARMTGAAYTNEALGFDRVEATATTGNDQATLDDSALDDFYGSYVDFSYMKGSNYVIKASSFDRVDANASIGYDKAEMSDSPGDDLFAGFVQFSYLSGGGKINRANGFDRVDAFASTGNDSASFSDTSGDDTLVTESGLSYLLAQGAPYLKAVGFDRIDATASSGNDFADLGDTVGDDYFFGSPEFAYISGSGYLAKATGFDRVFSYSRHGGFDQAELYDSAGDDFFEGHNEFSSMVGAGYAIRVDFYLRIDAFASSGHDTMVLFSGVGIDTFVVQPEFTGLILGSNNPRIIRANAFDRVQLLDGYFLDAVGPPDSFIGYDIVELYDSPGDDYFQFRADYTYLSTPGNNFFYLSGPGYYVEGIGFRKIHAHASTGTDVAQFTTRGNNDQVFTGNGPLGSLVDSNGGYAKDITTSNFDLTTVACNLSVLCFRVVLYDEGPNFSNEIFASGKRVELYTTNLATPGAPRNLRYVVDNYQYNQIHNEHSNQRNYVATFSPRDIKLQFWGVDGIAPYSQDVPKGNDSLVINW